VSLISGVVKERKLPANFSKDLLQLATQAAIKPASVVRENFCETPFITIDGQDARDFDDAVACEPTASGINLTVAIADVAAYVKPGDALDNEAKKRGNSVYLPDRVLPMLPPALSNDSCSLIPQQERLCLVCEMELRDGIVQRYRFARGTMRSRQRLTYDEAAILMKNGPTHMQLLGIIGEALRLARRQRGGFIMDRPEINLTLAANDDIFMIQNQRNIAHYAIEECMIAANRCAADFVIRQRLPALHRVHKHPPAENVKKLRAVLAELNIDFPSEPIARDFSDALDNLNKRDPDLGDNLLPLLLGTLARAEYAPDEKTGHFGLACNRYLHFTSPIRRYPDLLTHRAIISALEGKKSTVSHEELVTIGAQCSQSEINADKAGWECRQRLLCWKARNQIGLDFEGVVSGTTSFGVFVSIAELGVDGLVRLSEVPGFWKHDYERRQFVETGGQVLKLGSRLQVRLLSVAPSKGRADFKAIKIF
jgi:ribonuclease R